MKFKEGQKVKIIARGQAPPIYDINSSNWIGQLGTIKRADEEEGYWVTDIGDDKHYDWFDEDALEAVES